MSAGDLRGRWGGGGGRPLDFWSWKASGVKQKLNYLYCKSHYCRPLTQTIFVYMNVHVLKIHDGLFGYTVKHCTEDHSMT